MNKNLSSALAITAVALLLGGAAAWWVTRSNPSSAPTRNSNLPTTNLITGPVNRTVASKTGNPGRTRPNRINGNNIITPGTNTEAGSWEERLDQILLDDNTDENAKAKQLLAMMPRLDEEAQLEVVQHVVNLIDDESYEGVTQILTNELTPESVLSVLMTDMMNRKNTLKLPTFLQLAKNEEHPLKGEAKDLLEFYVEEDFGADWPKWEAAVQKWLKENPDDEPEPDK